MDIRILWFIERNFQNTRNFTKSEDSCFLLAVHNQVEYAIYYKELYLISRQLNGKEIYLFASVDVEETLEVLKRIINNEDIQPDTFTNIIANLVNK
jgi:hypothetical protein